MKGAGVSEFGGDVNKIRNPCRCYSIRSRSLGCPSVPLLSLTSGAVPEVSKRNPSEAMLAPRTCD